MIWKNGQDQQDWERLNVLPIFRLYILCLDEYRFRALDYTEITITSFLRILTLKPSYHGKGQALDIRTRDMTLVIENLFLEYAKHLAKLFNDILLGETEYEIQVVAHKELRGKPDQHIHIELDDGEPAKLEV